MAPATAPMQNGHQHRRGRERGTEVALAQDVRSTSLRNAKLEPRSTMPSAASESGTNSVSVIDANALGEAGPQHDEAEDQPDVVGLPHRPDRVRDDARGPRTALGAAGDEVPEAGAEVGAAEERVGGDADHQDHRDDVGSSDRLPLVRTAGRPARSGGPYGHLGLGLGLAGSRQRRLIRRRISTRVTPTPDVEHQDERGT